MPKSPRGEKRPADAIGLAVMVGGIAAGEIEDNPTPPEKTHHSRGGKKGGAARAAKPPKKRGPYKKRSAA